MNNLKTVTDSDVVTIGDLQEVIPNLSFGDLENDIG